ncbi:hypothetical protein BOTCAL_1394g00010 [Botryotinia calthae]|uniref:Retroviral polymerase SH3-like domain-containing protein n=1 Tax=Botryotinia calthae TaxID=38488 RepID=A0A4Y8CCP7_9HELO|nr:hypothetical protein BOTCAL_1394g00010 [Botryotinia calthae]
MDSRARKGILVGYDSSNNYLIYIPVNKRVISSRDVDIQENLIYSDKYKNQDLNLLEEENIGSGPIQDRIEEEDHNSIAKKQASPEIIEIDESEDETLDCIEVDPGEPTPSEIDPGEPIPEEAIEPNIRQSKRIKGLTPENKGLDDDGKNVISYYGLAFSGG